MELLSKPRFLWPGVVADPNVLHLLARAMQCVRGQTIQHWSTQSFIAEGVYRINDAITHGNLERISFAVDKFDGVAHRKLANIVEHGEATVLRILTDQG